MKIALTTSGNSLDSPLDSRFGRAPNFLIYDTDLESFEVIDNTGNMNAAQGAGIKAAEAVVRSGAQMLVTGHCGPRAFQVLSAAGIEIFNTDHSTVTEALEALKEGKLKPASSADVGGHWK